MENKSGLKPLGCAVLVKDYRPERKYGQIVLPPNVKDKQSMVDSRVEIIAIGENAWVEESSPRAKIGDIVLVGKFSGFMAGGADGELYRLVNDRDIFCGMDNAAFDAQAARDLGLKEVANG